MRQPTKFVFAGLVVAVLALLGATPQKAAPDPVTEAARVNNLGAAYMNQQLFEKGLKCFQDAAALDPKLLIARVNEGIAQLNLGRVDSARQLLEDAVKANPKDPNAWYNLGLLYKNSGDPQTTVAAFRRVTEIDADDADTWYFVGAAYAQGKQYPQAIEAFQHALKLNPLHASAEFGLARVIQQSGDAEHAREHLQKFQHITQAKLGTPISLAYGEQGKYSLVEESAASVEKVPAAIAVQFVDVTSRAGLLTKGASADAVDVASAIGSGGCFLDYDGDGRIDIFLPDNGVQGGMSLYHNLGTGKFEDVTTKVGLDPSAHGIGCTAADYDNDGFTDLAVSRESGIMLLHNDASDKEAVGKEKTRKFSDATSSAGITGGGTGLTFVDFDHDGDSDLFVSPAPVSPDKPQGPNLLWRNDGNGTFTDVGVETGIAAAVPASNAVGTDYNNDRAVDVATTGRTMVMLENPREGKFSSHQLWGSTPIPSNGVAVFDFNHDGWMDMVFTQPQPPAIKLWRNNRGKEFESAELPPTDLIRAYGVAALDYDNDGWVDFVAAGVTKEGKSEIRLFRNLGPDGFKDVTTEVGLDTIKLTEPRAILIGDYDNDGATDLLITQNHGPAVLLRNDGGNKNDWLRLTLKGLADNKSAIGTKVEILSGGNRQKFEVAGSSGYLGQNSPYLTIGLGAAKSADVVRMLWPSGVLQDEIEIAGGKDQSFTEMDRRGSSCPTLFVWDGTHYQLVGDMLGAGVVGHWVGPGQRDVPRPTEYIKIDRDSVHEKSGKLSFRFMEPLEEVVYLDQVKLIAVDHAKNIEVFPNEYFASNPPYPVFKVVYSRDARPPAGAWDEHGHDVLPDVLAHRFFGDFKTEPFHGFAKMHALELDLGNPYRGGPLWLLMHGEIEYFTATSMFAAHQAGIEGVSPYVEAQNAAGKWIRVMDDMGFPAGGARTMTADLGGKLPEGTKRIRITTNLEIYWDNILVSRTSQQQESRLTPVPLARADLSFHGFPLKVEGKPSGNVLYVYENASPTGPYTRPTGNYTRYGDVRKLITSMDDQHAVFGSGEEIALDFDPAGLPSLPHGWIRDYFFVANGYEKDMDFYAAYGDTVDPLPFRGMGTYPYPKGTSFPADKAHLKYLLEYNTRHMSGNESPGYGYDYGPAK